ncbi:MAG: hypothetical protein D6743_08825 [Calditrichaeota bacterium]|nr:MAG: hypothetical protein D6743_08825 [Calditrichota bacterium]
MNQSSQNFDPSADEIDLLDYLNVIIKRRRMILRNALVAGLLMAIISFILPRSYTAVTTILPPEDNEAGGLGALLANSPISLLDLPGVSGTSSEIFVEILKSRTVAEGVLSTKYQYKGKTQDLYEIWDADSPQEAIEKLSNRARIFANEQGIVNVAVEMETPELAAQVANAFVEQLDRVNKEKSFSKAKSSRLYIEEQLKLTQRNLEKASRALADFQSKYKAVNLEEQTKVAIEKAGEIKGTIMAKEVELEVARQTMKKDNPVVLRLQKELDELRQQYEHLQFGNSVPFEQKKDYFIPFADVPEVGLKFAELLREVKVQETVWQLLNQQYYTAKIQEARDTPTVQVLDVAVPPEKRSKPKRRLLVLVAMFLALTASVFAAFVLEYGERVKEREAEYAKLKQILIELKKDKEEAQKVLAQLWARVRKR